MPAESPSPNLEQVKALTARWIAAQPTISAYLSAAVRDFHAAEDLLQEIGEIVVSKYHEYDDSRSFTAWALGIARYRVLKYYERHKRDRLTFGIETLDNLASAFDRIEPETPAIRLALRECMNLLSGRARLSIELRYQEDWDPGKIAESLGTSRGNVNVILHRSRTALGKCIRRRIRAEEDAS